MRYLVRLPKPNILEQREISWTQSFIISGKDRPDNSKYSHLEIRTQLHNISYKKCFYSEVKFATETEGQVDHYVEVSENKNLHDLYEDWKIYQKPDKNILSIFEQRTKAKENRDFKLSDKLRIELKNLGWIIKDTKEGSVLERE